VNLGILFLLAFFGLLAWLMLKPKKGSMSVCITCGYRGETKSRTRDSMALEIGL
jgi:hypothetical protein